MTRAGTASSHAVEPLPSRTHQSSVAPLRKRCSSLSSCSLACHGSRAMGWWSSTATRSLLPRVSGLRLRNQDMALRARAVLVAQKLASEGGEGERAERLEAAEKGGEAESASGEDEEADLPASKRCRGAVQRRLGEQPDGRLEDPKLEAGPHNRWGEGVCEGQ